MGVYPSFILGSISFLFCLLSVFPQITALASSADAHQEKVFFDVPAQPLQQALLVFARQAGVEVVAVSDGLKGVYAPIVYGYYSIDRALTKLLRRSLLEYRLAQDKELFVITNKPPLALKNSEIGSIDRSSRIEEVVVKGVSYEAKDFDIVSSINQNGVSFFDSARYHTAISSSLIVNDSFSSLDDIVRYSSGTSWGESPYGLQDDYYIRGFKKNNLYVGPFRLSEYSTAVVIPENIESIDVLKGPSMLFYGQSSPGGVLSISQKQPNNKSMTGFAVKSDEVGSQRAFFEASSGKLEALSSSLRIAGLLHKHSPRRSSFDQQREALSMSSLSEFSEYSKLSMRYEYQRLDHEVLSVPTKESRGAVRVDRFFSSDSNIFSVVSNVGLSQNWRVVSGVMAQTESRYGLQPGVNYLERFDLLPSQALSGKRVAILRSTDGFLGLVYKQFDEGRFQEVLDRVTRIVDLDEHEESASGLLRLNGEFSLFSVSNRLVVGFDFYRQTLEQNFLLNDLQFDLLGVELSSAGVVWSEEILPQLEGSEVLASLRMRNFDRSRADSAPYFQVFTQWRDWFSSSLGVRYSRFSGLIEPREGTGKPLSADVSDISTQLGVSVSPWSFLSIFANYSESVSIKYRADDFDQVTKLPEASDQYEVGAKFSVPQYGVLGSVSLFQIENRNVRNFSLSSSFRRLSDPVKQVSKGLELDLSFELGDDYDLIVNYSYIDANDVFQDRGKTDREYVADNIYSAKLRYLGNDNIKASLGYYFVSDRYVNLIDRVYLESYKGLDVSLEYNFYHEGYSSYVRVNGKTLIGQSHKEVSVIDTANFSSEYKFGSLTVGVRF